jgi:hypothetical protein
VDRIYLERQAVATEHLSATADYSSKWVVANLARGTLMKKVTALAANQ